MRYMEVDGTGVSVRPGQAEGRPGKDDDGPARTREIKLARLFTQSGTGAHDKTRWRQLRLPDGPGVGSVVAVRLLAHFQVWRRRRPRAAGGLESPGAGIQQ
jgi:hypothetical protein